MELDYNSDEFWDCKEVFNERFEKLIDDFVSELPYSNSTKGKYSSLLYCLADYLHGYTNNISIETIKVGDISSRFYNQYKYDHDFEPSYQKYILKFFSYLKENGIENEKVLKHLSKK